MVGPMLAAFQAVEDICLDDLGAVVRSDACFDTAHVVRRIVVILDIAPQVYRYQPTYPRIRLGDPGTDGMIQVLEEKTVYGHPLLTASDQHFQRLIHREKMPGHRFGDSRSAAGRKPISPHGAFLSFAAVEPKLPQRRDHSTVWMLRFGKLPDLDPMLTQQPSKSADPITVDVGNEMPLHLPRSLRHPPVADTHEITASLRCPEPIGGNVSCESLDQWDDVS